MTLRVGFGITAVPDVVQQRFGAIQHLDDIGGQRVADRMAL
jgi:hypothetical protein